MSCKLIFCIVLPVCSPNGSVINLDNGFFNVLELTVQSPLFKKWGNSKIVIKLEIAENTASSSFHAYQFVLWHDQQSRLILNLQAQNSSLKAICCTFSLSKIMIEDCSPGKIQIHIINIMVLKRSTNDILYEF